MTYKESYQSCETEAEAIEKAHQDVKVAIFLGASQDRFKAIEDALNQVSLEKGWGTDGAD